MSSLKYVSQRKMASQTINPLNLKLQEQVFFSEVSSGMFKSEDLSQVPQIGREVKNEQQGN